MRVSDAENSVFGYYTHISPCFNWHIWYIHQNMPTNMHKREVNVFLRVIVKDEYQFLLQWLSFNSNYVLKCCFLMLLKNKQILRVVWAGRLLNEYLHRSFGFWQCFCKNADTFTNYIAFCTHVQKSQHAVSQWMFVFVLVSLRRLTASSFKTRKLRICSK